MDDLKVAIPEKGEVLIEWGDRKEVVSLPNEPARQLDLKLPGAAPGQSGILAMMWKEIGQYPVPTCEIIIRAAFQANNIPLSDAEYQDLEEEIGAYMVGSIAVQLLRPVMLGKKKFQLFLEMEKAARTMDQITPENSLGPNGSASPSESST